MTALAFSVRRLLRLYPTFFICLTGCAAAFGIIGSFAFAGEHFWANARLADFSILGASWTLQVEFLAVPFILVSFWSYQRWGWVGIGVSYLALFFGLKAGPFREHLHYFLRFLSCFTLGFLVPTQTGATVARRLSTKMFPLASDRDVERAADSRTAFVVDGCAAGLGGNSGREGNCQHEGKALTGMGGKRTHRQFVRLFSIFPG